LNKKSKPCIRALKSEMTSKIHEDGIMDMTALANIKELYFGGDMEAAPALSGQSVGLIDAVKSVDTIIKETINEFNETCLKLSKEKFNE
jgi:enoyl-[acyl-carrier protein] reductase II